MTGRCSWTVSATASAACSTCRIRSSRRQIYEKQIGKQLNMVSQSWDGKRLYFSSSLLARWDKGGDDNEQFVSAYAWDGKELTPKFALDFTALKLGRPHHMLFGSTKIGNESADWFTNQGTMNMACQWQIPSVLMALVFGAGASAADLTRTADHDYDPPAPGSYTLPVIKQATDGEVLDARVEPFNSATWFVVASRS